MHSSVIGVRPYLHICYERVIHKILKANPNGALDFYMPIRPSTEPSVWFYFYSIIKAFNLGQQFYTQNDQNAISLCWSNRIGNLFEIDMGGAHERIAASRLYSLVNGTRSPDNGSTRPSRSAASGTLCHCSTDDIGLTEVNERDVLGRRTNFVNK